MTFWEIEKQRKSEMADTKMSEEQVAELKQAFNEFDVDGGGEGYFMKYSCSKSVTWGTINTTELGYAMRAMGMNPTEQELLDLINEVRKIFYNSSTSISLAQYDTDGSGMIEFPEFCNMMSDKMNAVNDEDMIRMAFRVLDKYGTGTISSKSFKHLMTHIGNYQPEVWLTVITASVDLASL